MTMRRIGIVAGSVVAATALAACGSSSGGSAGIKTVAFTPLTQADFGSAVSTEVKGVRSAHMTITSSLLSANADIGYGPPLAAQMTMQMSAQGQTVNVQMRLVGTVMYMQIPGQTPAGMFISADLAKFPPTSRMFKLIAQIQHYGPTSVMSQFKKGVKSVQYLGAEQIDGRATRHYAVTVDTAAIVKLIGNNPAVSAFASQLKTITEQVYLDANRRPVRITMSLPAPAGFMQIEFSNWGEPVHVVAPPASQILSLPMGGYGTGA